MGQAVEAVSAGRLERREVIRSIVHTLLEPEVAAAFPTEEAVNAALCGVLNTTRAVRDTGGLSDKALQPTNRATAQAKPKKAARAARG